MSFEAQGFVSCLGCKGSGRRSHRDRKLGTFGIWQDARAHWVAEQEETSWLGERSPAVPRGVEERGHVLLLHHVCSTLSVAVFPSSSNPSLQDSKELGFFNHMLALSFSE